MKPESRQLNKGPRRTSTVHDATVVISENRRINERYYRLCFRCRVLARDVLPGQFMNIKILSGGDPFLRRPFSYYGVRGDRISILYEVLGQGTAVLAAKRVGETLKVLGPLGRPFSLATGRSKRVLVAGGIGAPPLIYLSEKVRSDYLLIGVKSRKEVLPAAELKRVTARVLYATEDGSYGVRGLVTRLFDEIIRQEGAENIFVQTCGPKGMMQAVLDRSRAEDIPGEASLDENMACGVGACLGCMVETVDGLRPSCSEGPVFAFDRIKRIVLPRFPSRKGCCR